MDRNFRIVSPDTPEDESITLSKSALSQLGLFVVDYGKPRNGFPSRYWKEFGYTTERHSDESWQSFVHPDDRHEVEKLLTGTFTDPQYHGSSRFRIQDAAGSWHWLLATGVVESLDQDGQPSRYIGFNHEVTATAELEEELREARRVAEEQAVEAETLRTAGAVITSSLSRIDAATYVTSHLKYIVPTDRVLVFEKTERTLASLDGSIVVSQEAPHDMDRTDAKAPDLDSVFFHSRLGINTLYELLRRRAPDVVREPTRAHTFWLLIPLVSRNDVIGVIAAVRRDGRQFEGREIRFAMAISDYMSLALVNARLYDEMRRLATFDQLSGLLTRRAFFERCEHEIRGLDDSSLVTALILDIDFFKRINDDFGHVTGDGAIRAIAEVFHGSLREGDIVGRYGGEEFCALLPGTSKDEGALIAQRICDNVRYASVEGIDRRITVSIGVATSTHGARTDLSELLNRADTALYAAKRNGRDQVQTEDHGQHDEP